MSLFATENLILFTISTILASITIRLAIPLAFASGILDRPGQHKQHKELTPFVGGIGIMTSLLIALWFLIDSYPEQLTKWIGLGVSSIIIFAMGLIDDIRYLGYKIRLVVQASAILIMILLSDVMLADLGHLLSEEMLVLSRFAIPFTIFTIIGGINALNMIDGIDGLSGSIALTSLLLLGSVAFFAGNQPCLLLISALAGGTLGFLFFNLRHRFRSRASVFLGDNGSMLLGYLLAWLLIALAQDSDNSSRAMTPVTALWLFSIPLMDTVSIMLRRLWNRKSPFKPDHSHLHHIMLNAGYRVSDTIITIVSLHLLLGAIGLIGLYFGVAESFMLIGFLFIFSGYFYLTLHPWYLINAMQHLHMAWQLTPTQSHELFLGSYSAQEAENLINTISKELHPDVDSLIHVVPRQSQSDMEQDQYAIVVKIRLLDMDPTTTEGSVKKTIASLQRQVEARCHIQLRHFVERDIHNERRNTSEKARWRNRRKIERRGPSPKMLVFEAIFDQASATNTQPRSENQ